MFLTMNFITVVTLGVMVGMSWGMFSGMQPFFFMCNFEGGLDQAGVDSDEVTLSVSIVGNPSYYTPGQMYQVSISSSRQFDGLMITGVYPTMKQQTMFNPFMSPMMNPAPVATGQTYMCSIVHQHLSMQPQTVINFLWFGPAKDTGCVNFLATASLGQQFIFKDTLALELCEEGEEVFVEQLVQRKDVILQTMILRDNFDKSPDLDSSLWSELQGGSVSQECGPVIQGNSVVFCQPTGTREISTVHLNATTGSVIQFAISAGTCKAGYADYSIEVSYALRDTVDWHLIDKVSAPISDETNIHIVHLPEEARTEDLVLRWHQDIAMDVYRFQGCWALDNVLIVNAVDKPTTLQDDFDPVNPTNWLFYPTASIKNKCYSDGKALVFHGSHDNQQGHQFVTSRDVNLYQESSQDALFEENFEASSLLFGWEVSGSTIGDMCGAIHDGYSAIFNGKHDRRLCTPYINTDDVHNLKFYFAMGSGTCDPGDSVDVEVSLYAQQSGLEDLYLLKSMDYQAYRKPKLISVAVPSNAQTLSTRFCFIQHQHDGENRHVWAVDNFQMLPRLPSNVNKYLQFSLNLECGSTHPANQIVVEMSTDHGTSWSLVHSSCLPGNCTGSHWSETTIYTADEHDGWFRTIVPLPYTTLTRSTRFRWTQPDIGISTNWALDSVYIGDGCGDGMCSGHGFCTGKGCSCDAGYSGPKCNIYSEPLPTHLREHFESELLEDDYQFSEILGGQIGFQCGILSQGKSFVFNQAGSRILKTQELDTTTTRYVQFTIRLGSYSTVGGCQPPDIVTESVFVHYSCNGGIVWNLLDALNFQLYQQPKVVTLWLPVDAHKPGCMFRWWQPTNSGLNKDVWAIDDITIATVLHNTISSDFSDTQIVNEAFSFHRGEIKDACGYKKAFSFSGTAEPGNIRYIETQSLQLGPSSMVQFDLMMGCGQPYNRNSEQDNRVYFDYSTTHGLTWQPVVDSCLPPASGCDEYKPSSVYDDTEYKLWTRISVPLKSGVSSVPVRFRWLQSSFTGNDSWAIDNVYIGQQCPDYCHGHGRCHDGDCRCDPGYSGDTCTPDYPLVSTLRSDFEDYVLLQSDWLAIHGGYVVNGNQGCGVITSGLSLYFSEDGIRQLVSLDMNTQVASFVQFYIRIGGGGVYCVDSRNREEGVLLQYSNNGGITWTLLMELYYQDYTEPRFVHKELPSAARTPSTRFRWWQPSHSGAGYNQWAIDDIYIGSDNSLNSLQADFQNADISLVISDIWTSISNGNVGQLCHSDGTALVFSGNNGDRYAITEYMNLQIGDIIQFKIVIGCGQDFQTHNPVYLQYSVDAGLHWNLVIKPCHPFIKSDDYCEGLTDDYQDGSVYHMGLYNKWRLVVIPVDEDLTGRKIQFRWLQPSDKSAPDFALDDVYIGPACPDMCNGRGVCFQGECVCQQGFHGSSCTAVIPPPTSASDRFDGNDFSGVWELVVGGEIGTSCGILARGHSMYFGQIGPREGRTAELNTTTTKILQFYIRIGSTNLGSTCEIPVSRQEDIIIQYSRNHGITWHMLHQLDAKSFSLNPELVTIELPRDAKSDSTSFRWLQPYLQQDIPRSQWALDNVLIGANDTCSYGFQDDFHPGESNMWYMIHGGQPQSTCQSKDYALYFDSKEGTSRYAETWDFHVTTSTFLQFELMMGCGEVFTEESSVRLEYSLDMGKTWQLVLQECVPPNIGCHSYHQESVYISQLYSNKTRVSVYLPPATSSPATRFRWIQPEFADRKDNWALDYVYLGDECPWMCSGHGKCCTGKCKCDSGYFGYNCVPLYPLPPLVKDNFDDDINSDTWPYYYGADISKSCGTLISGSALVFSKSGLRMLESASVDSTNMEYVQFTVKFGCGHQDEGGHADCSRGILVQYSNNGGITWHLLEEIMYDSDHSTPSNVNIQLPMAAKLNATKFRLWQPKNSGEDQDVWAIDNIIFGGNSKQSNVIKEDFTNGVSESDWLFYPGSHVGPFCPPRFPSGYDKRKEYDRIALVFGDHTGEHSVTTRDVHVSEESVLQFEINIGCSELGSAEHSVYLEYSRDYGATWTLLQPLCIGIEKANSVCENQMLPASIYYRGATEDWQRYIISLAPLHICGNVRFRWYQGVYKAGETSIAWGLDDVYIGDKCPDFCSGHGVCLGNKQCQCDQGYAGPNCYAVKFNPRFLKESFESKEVNSLKFTQWSGGVITEKCGILITGKSLHFVHNGIRMLLTTDMDLTTTSSIHFYIKLGCSPRSPSPKNRPVLLQFSSNGGLSWSTMEELHFMHDTNKPAYVAVELPWESRTNSTRIRWWQPSSDGTYIDEWAIDQIFLGGDVYGQMVLEDDFTSSLQQDGISSPHDTNWMLYPGSQVEQVCGSSINALHFTGNSFMRYAISADLMVTEFTFLQFDLAMGCSQSDLCYDIILEYSTDMGKHWDMLLDDCLPLNVDCMKYHTRSIFTADVYNGWNRIIIPLPVYTRSKSTRFRWSQPVGFEPAHTWAIRYVYIGDECMDLCSGHGRCDVGICVCDDAWAGDTCNIPLKPLPKQLRDKFEKPPDKAWITVNGGLISDICEPLPSGKALHFYGACTRQLITTDLDLSEVKLLQFYFKYGCMSVPSNRNQGVFVEYSVNGGISWQPLTELFYDQFTQPSFISVQIPAAARRSGARLRWWQPKHSGQGKNDWAIDNVLLAGSESLSNSLKDRFDDSELDPHWLYLDNSGLGSFCQADSTTNDVFNIVQQVGDTNVPLAPALIGLPAKGENVSIITEDLLLDKDSILQFKISVGCNKTSSSTILPVHLTYSTDHGMTWSYLIPQCLPYDPQCNGEVTQPSVYFANVGWRRVTINLPEKVLERPVRFRWWQEGKSDPPTPQWAIDDIFISRSCRNICNGHGTCDYPQCICDDGYYGVHCGGLVTTLQTTIKERFREPDADVWSLIQGGKIVTGRYSCGIIREESSLYFHGYGLRQLETIDLDLRGASFIQYHAVVGSHSDTDTCEKPISRNENVIIQYSIDGGISWRLLHELDYEHYLTPQQDYIPLPTKARTESTKIRWWQPVDMETYRYQAQWAIDDILIGGSDINPSFIAEYLDNKNIAEDNWEFYPNAILTHGVCGNHGYNFYWQGGKGDTSDNTMATRQLIVTDNFMIQFKIVVGCGSQTDHCSSDEPVRLEYNTDPVKPRWQLLESLCLPGIVDHVECLPHYYHTDSVYDTNGYNQWTRIVMQLPDTTISSSTQFRWRQPSATRQAPSWSLDDIYIGEQCPQLCNGHGICVETKRCICDAGYHGESCELPISKLPRYMIETFEAAITSSKWSSVRGGAIGRGCGSLLPYAHGKNLYFNGCGIREAVTIEMDTTKASEIQFVIQIGSTSQTTTCNMDYYDDNIENKAVLLQYSINNGIDWRLIETHDVSDYLTAKRVTYELPTNAKNQFAKFRWWQPSHGGIGHDQWALDHVELILPREEKMRHSLYSFNNGRGKR